MTETSKKTTRLPSVAVRLAGVWLLAGALLKLFRGTPKDLPDLIRKLTPFDIDLTFHLVIGVELFLVCLSVLRPKLAWVPLAALFVFFEFVLMKQIAAGAESCGCFGPSIKVDPRVMVAIDAALLAFMLLSRPWSRLSSPGGSALVLALAAAASFLVPWLYLSSVENPPSAPGAQSAGTSGASDGSGQKPLPRWVTIKPSSWVGKLVYDIQDLADWIAADKLPTDGTIVLWRQGCTHCAAHLKKMAEKNDITTPIVLIQIRDDLKDGRAVEAMPQGPNVTQLEFPENLQFVIQTPWEIHVEGGTVTAALDEEHVKALEPGGESK